MRKTICLATTAVTALALAAVTPAPAQQQQRPPADFLAQGFVQPPDSAKPRTWWHWTNGNVTETGITKDLEWMHRVGIGGFQLVDVSAGKGQVVEPKIHFATPEWYHAVLHSAQLAKQLGLEMSIFSCAGWSEAGGPWITQEMAEKRLVWSETTIPGGQPFTGKLAKPPSNEGPVRDLRVGGNPQAGAPSNTDAAFYRDSAVVAYRTPEDDVPMSSLHPAVTSSNGSIDPAALLDSSLNTGVTLPISPSGPTWLQYEFSRPYTARALSLGVRGIPVSRILASDDGQHFRTILDTPGPQGYHGATIRTFAFPAVTARFFRIEFDRAALSPAEVIHGASVGPPPANTRRRGPARPRGYNVTEAIFYSSARVNRWEDKGAFGSLMDRYDIVPTPSAPAAAEIASSDVVNLTGKMDSDGTLHWDPPAGHWTVLRMGYALTGNRNRPSVPAGSGLEVDKLSSKYVTQYFNGYIDPIKQHLGGLLGQYPHYMTMDSWEAGMQNWTDDMIAQFKNRRGYDPTPWMPVLAGHVVGSAQQSDQFLWDFRRTLADLYAGEFYGTMDNELHKVGMAAYSEASGVALEIPEDTLLNKSHIDIPMAEFWVHALHPESMYYVDVRGAASAAHVYGKPLVATESFTGGGYESPYTFKKIADYWFAQGVNRLVFHTSAEQPLDTKPGNTMVGSHINRNITWAELAKPFMTYIARVSYMLQQGSPNADLAYLLPEGAPSTMPFWGSGLQPAPPPGFDYDYINTDILLHHTSVLPDGRIHVAGSAEMPEGVTYRLLVLPPTRQMTPEVALKLHELVAAGATITGPRPTEDPSLSPNEGAAADLHALTLDLWGDMDGVTLNQHPYGKGMVYSGLSLDEILSRLHTPRDFDASGSIERPPAWIHRHTPTTDIYFVANQADNPVHLKVRVRTPATAVSIFRPMDGSIVNLPPTAYFETALLDERTGNRQPGLEPAVYAPESGFTTVPLSLAERESVFIVLHHPAGNQPAPAVQEVSYHPTTLHSATRPETTLTTLSGPWTITFPPELGAPATLKVASLTPWTGNSNPGIKYFSGTATYTRTLTVPAAWLKPGRRILLSLGDVRDIAQIHVNGKDSGVTWAPPYQVDITAALHPGANHIQVAVTDEWTNRIMGDRLDPAHPILAGPLPPSFGPPPTTPPTSGLLGPVTLVSRQQ